MKPPNSPPPLPELASALDRLPPVERTALQLRDVQQLPLPQVALRLGCSVRAARFYVAQGRVQLLRAAKP